MDVCTGWRGGAECIRFARITITACRDAWNEPQTPTKRWTSKRPIAYWSACLASHSLVGVVK